ncbi:MAG: nucleoside triphosphate pyrophosphohydrolase [Syntrophomonadaceae bacterium]|jgi:tetrapyrrole methylase family protein/MazG family protein
MSTANKAKAIEELIEVMDRLLGPQGCPWDREQTHESLIRYLIEESYEVIEAIKERDMNKLRDELGDLLLQIVFHANLAQQEGQFDFYDVAAGVSQKMINRHPHVFGDAKPLHSGEDVMEVWEGYKKREGKENLLEGIPKFLPALMRAEKVQEKAARVGFDWPSVKGAVEKFKEEVEEWGQAVNKSEEKEEFGDILFALVNIARFRNIEPEQALQAANDKFSRRFNYIEKQVKESNREFKDMSLEELDIIWEEAKAKGL